MPSTTPCCPSSPPSCSPHRLSPRPSPLTAGNNNPSPYPPFSGDQFKKYTISAKGIEASFIPYGARLTNLLVKDKHGKTQDVVLGYDDGKQYLKDTEGPHTYFGPVVGRYANR